MIALKRVYVKYDKGDGYRILVDRLWPRGVSKKEAHVDEWLKEIAPSNELRKWFNHDPHKWGDFKKKYRAELRGKSDLVKQLKEAEEKYKHITLLYGAQDETHNQAVVLAEMIKKK